MSIPAIAVISIIVYSGLVLLMGYWGWRGTKPSPEDYFLAGRTIGTVAMILTVSATYHSVFYFFGVPGYHYYHGFPAAPAVVGFGAMMVVSMWLFLPRFYLAGKAFNYITPADYLADYYQSSTLRVVVGLMTLFYMVPYLSIQTIGVAVGFESITQGAIPYTLGASIFLLVIMTYVLIGGFRAVVWTDVVQGLIFSVLAWVIALWFLFYLGNGSLSEALRIIGERYPANLHIPGGAGTFTFQEIFNFMLLFGLAAGLQPQIWMRGYAAKSIRLFPVLVAGLAVLAVLGQLANLLTGVSGRAFAGVEVANPDAMIATVLGQHAPIFGVVVLLAAVAASMSTTDSLMLAASASLTRDLYQHFRRNVSERELYNTGRIFIVCFAVISFLVSLTRPGFIIAFSQITWTGFALLIPLVLGSFHWKRGTTQGAVAGLIAGNIVDLVILLSVWPSQSLFGWHFGIYGIVVCTIVYVVVSLLTQPMPASHLERFHRLYRRAYQEDAGEVAG